LILSQIARFSYDILLESAPYILFGVFFAGLIQVFLKAESLKKWLAGKTTGAVVRASLFGVPLPLCSCSVLPVAMQLRKGGASRGATSAFLASTPQTGVDSIVLTLGLLNPVFAIARVVAAFATGLVAGIAQNIADKDNTPAPNQSSPSESKNEKPVKSCCGGAKNPEQNESTKPSLTKRFLQGQHYAFTDLLPSMSGFFLIGFIATGVVMALLPDGFLETYLGGGLLGMLIVCLVGVAVYICASAATPLAAGLILKGMSPGTALVMLLAGPVVSMASLAAIRSMLGLKGLIIYLITVIACAISMGLLLDWFYTASGIAVVVSDAVAGHSHASMISHILAIGLGGLMIYSVGRPLVTRILNPQAGKKSCCQG
jgi:uncharacterized protein